MGAPLVIFDEAVCLTALRTVLVAVVSPPNGPIAAADVYRSRPAAAGGVRGLSVTYKPTTPVPVDDGPFNDEAAVLQRQVVNVLVAAPVQPVSSFTVLGELASYASLPGDGPAEVAAGLVAAVDLLGLGVGVSVVNVSDVVAVQLFGGTIGLSLNVQVIAGALAKVTADDSTRTTSWNWSSWTVRIVVQDVVDAAGNCRAGAVAERIRRALQAESWPLVNGVAYPYLRDVLAEANLGFEQVLGPPIELDGLDGGVWVRRVGLDVVFRPSTGVTYDVPSLDTIGFQPPVVQDP